MAVINGTEIDLMPTAGMREEAQDIEIGNQKEKVVVQKLLQEEQHKY